MTFDDMPALGRNDNCWCGSGKKYKKCHLANDERMEALALEGYTVLPRSLLKSEADIAGIKESAKVNVGVLDFVADAIKPGVTTEEIDQWVYDYCISHDSIPADLNYEGFPKSVCTSINDVVCHGIPSEKDVLQSGDIVNVDMSTIKNGYFSDSSRMFCIGEVSEEARRLVEVTHDAVQAGLQAIKPWGFLGEVSVAVNKCARDAGYSVVRQFGGHGIGKEFHEDPWVGFYDDIDPEGPVLVPGLCFTIEPMVNAGKAQIDSTDPNGWTIRTADGSLSAQWEVQVVITEEGYELISW